MTQVRADLRLSVAYNQAKDAVMSQFLLKALCEKRHKFLVR